MPITYIAKPARENAIYIINIQRVNLKHSVLVQSCCKTPSAAYFGIDSKSHQTYDWR